MVVSLRRYWLGPWGENDDGMKWPQFELWRLFESLTCFGVASGFLSAALRPTRGFDGTMGLLASVFLGVALGIPFRRGLIGVTVAFGVLVVAALVITVIVIVYSPRS